MNIVKCPICGKEIENESFYCDQCGEELKICPSGHGFMKGKYCVDCRTKLVVAKNIQVQPAVVSPSASQVQPQATDTRQQLTTTIQPSPVDVENVPQQQTDTAEKPMIFICYSHKDIEYLERLIVHLKPFEKKGLINVWSDTKIKAGEKWKEQIENALEKSVAAILLISADFLGSDFIGDNELPSLLKSADEKGIPILSVIIKPCRFIQYENLSKFQAVNDPKNPLCKMDESGREEVYVKIAEYIERVPQQQTDTAKNTIRHVALSTEPKYLISTALNARLELKNDVIGRKEGAYVNVFGNQGYISRTHARLQKNDAGVWEIIDLNSTCGTFLNGQQLVPNQPYAFKIGDTITFYNLNFLVSE